MIQLQQAAAFFAQGKIQEAEKLYRLILQTDPENGGACHGLGRVAMHALHFEAAKELFAKSSDLIPGDPLPLIDLGNAYAALRQFESAGKCYKRAVDIAPEDAQAQYTHGIHLSGTGAAREAEQCLRATIKLEPSNGYAYSALVRLKEFSSAADEDITAMERLLRRGDLSPANQMAVQFALGKAFYDIGDKRAAFSHLEEANALQRERCSFSVSDMRPFFSSVKETFSAEVLRNRNIHPNTSLTPIFIVGQPRSGSTLLEQMMCSHSEIAAAGELPYIGREVATALSRITKKPFPDACACLELDHLRELAEIYLNAVENCTPGYRYITDKLPANYQSVGLISMFLPHAKVVNIRRHPMDNCFSIFRNFFNEDEPYFCSLPEIGEYYRIYEDIMAIWHEKLPGFVLDVYYEDLVADPKNVLTGVLEFCGLSWQDKCLEFHINRRFVQTLSENQIRQKIHSGGIGAWKEYEQYLKPLKNSLGDSIEKYEGRDSKV